MLLLLLLEVVVVVVEEFEDVVGGGVVDNVVFVDLASSRDRFRDGLWCAVAVEFGEVTLLLL